jgi:hypothetical protein
MMKARRGRPALEVTSFTNIAPAPDAAGDLPRLAKISLLRPNQRPYS